MPKSDAVVFEECEEIIKALAAIKEDESVPKNVKSTIDIITAELRGTADHSTKMGKALQHLDEIAEDMNVPPLIRTQIWNVSSMLEKWNHHE